MKITRFTNGSGLTNIARASKSRVSGSSSARPNGTFRKIVPKASATIDHSHLGQEAALAVADHDHLVERRVLALGIDVLAHRDERFPQTHRRQRDGIATVIEEEP